MGSCQNLYAIVWIEVWIYSDWLYKWALILNIDWDPHQKWLNMLPFYIGQVPRGFILPPLWYNQQNLKSVLSHAYSLKYCIGYYIHVVRKWYSLYNIFTPLFSSWKWLKYLFTLNYHWYTYSPSWNAKNKFPKGPWTPLFLHSLCNQADVFECLWHSYPYQNHISTCKSSTWCQIAINLFESYRSIV